MAEQFPTVQELYDFKRDLDDAALIVNGNESTVVSTRYGGDKPSIARAVNTALQRYAAFNVTGDWVAGNQYQVNDLWFQAGQGWYLVLVPYTSGEMPEDDIAAQTVTVYSPLELTSSAGGMYPELDQLIFAVSSGLHSVGSTVLSATYHPGLYLGGNLYLVEDAGSASARPSSDGGTIIHVGSNGLYLKGLFTDGKYRLTQFGGGRGNQSEDTAAAQAMIDAGMTHCLLDENNNEYELLGLVAPRNQEFVLHGVSRQKCQVAVRGQVIVYGDINQPSNFLGQVHTLRFNIYSDVTDGVIEARFCRNFTVYDVFVSDGDNTNWIGHFLNLNKSYQCKLSDIHGRWYGGALYEVGASSGNEVLDTITTHNVVWHGNYGVFQRPGPINMHNLVFDNTKFRDKRNSPEWIDEHSQGETRLAADALAGANSFIVTDMSQLNYGNLLNGQFLYIGYDRTAEQVRVDYISGNTVYLETPLRFDHSADINGLGNGEPVIYGAVFVSLGFNYSLNIQTMHCEGGWIALHAMNVRGASINNFYSTCYHTFRPLNKCRSWKVDIVTMGNKNWGTPILFHVPDYHNPDNNHFDIAIYKQVNSDSGVNVQYVVNDSLQDSSSIFSYNVTAREYINRSLGVTIVPKHMSECYITMTGRIDDLTVQDGVIPSQKLRIYFTQDSNGHRFIVAWSNNVTLRDTLFLSSRPYAQDWIDLVWSGNEWDEVARYVADLSELPPEESQGQLIDIDDELNQINKYAGKNVLETVTGRLLRAAGPLPADPWLDVMGVTRIMPGEPLPDETESIPATFLIFTDNQNLTLDSSVIGGSETAPEWTIMVTNTKSPVAPLWIHALRKGLFHGQRARIINTGESYDVVRLSSVVSSNFNLSSDYDISVGASTVWIYDNNSEKWYLGS